MAVNRPAADLPSRIGGAADAWDDGLVGQILSEDYFDLLPPQQAVYSVVYAASLGTPTGPQIVAGTDENDDPALHAFWVPYTGAGFQDEPDPGWEQASSGTQYRQAWVLYDQLSNTYSNVVEALLTTLGSAVAGFNVWSGSIWEMKPVKVWNGSSWETKPLKHYDGVWN